MIVKPTLHFNGRCAEAIALYKAAFGCVVRTLIYADAPAADGRKRVMHSEVELGNIIIRLSDGLSADYKPAVFPLFMSLNFDTAEQVHHAASVLEAAGGQITEPFESYSFSACMGSIVDPFGFRWRMMVE